MDPKPWIFAQFAAANIGRSRFFTLRPFSSREISPHPVFPPLLLPLVAASTILVSSNPTNLILTSSFGISFTTYSAWVILPSLAAAVAAFPVLLYWEHHTDVPEWLEGVDVEPGRALVDPWGAIIGSGLLAATLVVLVAGSAAGVLGGVWEVGLSLSERLR